MKNNTYDVPAYKFGIVKIEVEGTTPDKYFPSDYECAITSGQCTIIPFENVDGLTVDDVTSFLKTKELHLIAYVSYEKAYIGGCGVFRDIVMQIHADNNLLDHNPTKTVDKVFEKILESHYNHMTDKAKRVSNCFFERYQDKSYEDTKSRIKRLEQPK